MEGCNVFIASQTTNVVERDLALQDERSKYLLWPKDEINSFDEENSEKYKNKEDLHMVFEYAEGDTILDGRFRAPRSNRFYFVHDPNGGKLK
jgi:ADP-dependent phosphofructokinase/glucokinase